ncbi:hypothetical protein [Kitasatospora sp. NPDC001527]|uniref:hypothetical protein n=1 Tax=Kitasatospora sp. NPDC001527 TaxID=3154519 RepID=UPI003333D7F9
MPFPRATYTEPVVPAPAEPDEDNTWYRLFEDEDEDAARRCQCPYRAYRGCVDGLGLPPLGSLYVHPDGRRGMLVRRVRRHDPITLTIVQTAVQFEHVNGDGTRAVWSLKCAGLSPAE